MIHPFIRSFVSWFVDSVTPWLMHSWSPSMHAFTQTCIDAQSCFHPFIHSSIRPLIQPAADVFMYPSIHWFLHAYAHSPVTCCWWCCVVETCEKRLCCRGIHSPVSHWGYCRICRDECHFGSVAHSNLQFLVSKTKFQELSTLFACALRGQGYIGVTDHSPQAQYTGFAFLHLLAQRASSVATL